LRVDRLNLVLIVGETVEVEEDDGRVRPVAGRFVAARAVVAQDHVAVVNDGLDRRRDLLVGGEFDEQERVALGRLGRERRGGQLLDARRVVARVRLLNCRGRRRDLSARPAAPAREAGGEDGEGQKDGGEFEKLGMVVLHIAPPKL
jgi:hypothetical protein